MKADPDSLRHRWHVAQGWYILHRGDWFKLGRWRSLVHTWRTYRVVYGRGGDRR